MGTIFNFQYLSTDFIKETRTLEVGLGNSEVLPLEMLFELKSLFSWCVHHPEVSSILLQSKRTGPLVVSPVDLKSISNEKMEKMQTLLSEITYGVKFLPQTIVVHVIGELENDLKAFVSELVLLADFVFMDEGASLQFNHFFRGVDFAAGNKFLLEKLFGRNLFLDIVSTGRCVGAEELVGKGIVKKNTQNNEVQQLLKSIYQQSTLLRTTLKNNQLMSFLAEYERAIELDKKSLPTIWKLGEWRNNSFYSVQEISKCASLSASVKSDQYLQA